MLCLSLGLLCWSSQLYAEQAGEEIELLILSIENSHCEFIRNGKHYTDVEAAEHLRLKYRRGMKLASSAKNFIDRLASKSSLTGKPYLLACPGSGEQTASSWLQAKLQVLRGE